MNDLSIQIYNNREKIELAEECGLTFTGEFEGEEPQFIGGNREWDYYNNGGVY